MESSLKNSNESTVCLVCNGEGWFWLPLDKEATPCYDCRGLGRIKIKQRTELNDTLDKVLPTLAGVFEWFRNHKYKETTGLEDDYR